MTTQRILLAGATGAVGGELLPLLRARGFFVRALSRSPKNAERLRDVASEVVLADATRPAELAGVFDGIDIVVSCLGANVSLSLRERRGFFGVDVPANTNMLEAAKAAGAHRFVYLSAHPAPGFDHTRYIRAHLEVEARIRASGLSFSFVHPTGIFTSLSDFVGMARAGFGSVPGDGRAKANPVHPLDVAEALADVLLEGPAELPVGGPDVFTREEVMRLAFEAIGKEPRIMKVPVAVFHAVSAALALPHPRLSEMLEFVAAVTTSDSVAPARGTRHLRDWFETIAGKKVKG